MQGVQHRGWLGCGCAAAGGAGPRLRPPVLRVRGPQVMMMMRMMIMMIMTVIMMLIIAAGHRAGAA